MIKKIYLRITLLLALSSFISVYSMDSLPVKQEQDEDPKNTYLEDQAIAMMQKLLEDGEIKEFQD